MGISIPIIYKWAHNRSSDETIHNLTWASDSKGQAILEKSNSNFSAHGKRHHYLPLNSWSVIHLIVLDD